MEDGGTHYDLLQVREDASTEVIKGAYKYLSQKWHPDRNSAFKDEAERMSQRLNEAYSVLSDPAKRAEYDDWLAAQRGRIEEQTIAPPTAPANSSSNPGCMEIPRTILLTILLTTIALMAAYALFKNGIGVTVRYASDKCRPNHLLVTTTNRLPIPLNSHAYDIEGYEQGYSDWKRSGSNYRTDRVVHGWSSLSVCKLAPQGNHHRSEIPERAAEIDESVNSYLQWKAEVKYARWSGDIEHSNY